MKALLALALVAGAIGCATTPKAPQDRDAAAKSFRAPAGKGNVYVYRPSRFGTLVTCSVLVDGRWASDLPARTFAVASLQPGQHEVQAVWSDSTAGITVNVEPGRTYFLKIGVDKTQPWRTAIAITQVAEVQAQDEIRSCDLVRASHR